MAFDWTTFTLPIFIDRPQETVLDFWLSSGALEKWFLTKAAFFDASNNPLKPKDAAWAGCRYRWEWVEGSVEEGDVVVVEKPSTFQVSWFGSAGKITVTTEFREGRTLLTLRQSCDLGDEEKNRECYSECSMGWNFYLTNLKSIAEGGIDLREKIVTTKNSGLINV